MAAPETRIASLEFLTAAEKQQKGAAQQERKQSQMKKLMNVAPKAVDIHSGSKDKQ
jgi:hypothetical protein